MKPQRTCVVCRKVVAKEDLLRFILGSCDKNSRNEENVEVEIDISGCSSGRGAYCHLGSCLLNRELYKKIIYSLITNYKKKGIAISISSQFDIGRAIEKATDNSKISKNSCKIKKLIDHLDNAISVSQNKKGIRL
jgi:predicted RNA-binding protein YlxR (DUF448 family)